MEMSLCTITTSYKNRHRTSKCVQNMIKVFFLNQIQSHFNVLFVQELNTKQALLLQEWNLNKAERIDIIRSVVLLRINIFPPINKTYAYLYRSWHLEMKHLSTKLYMKLSVHYNKVQCKSDICRMPYMEFTVITRSPSQKLSDQNLNL